jgi:hypothetical protein
MSLFYKQFCRHYKDDVLHVFILLRQLRLMMINFLILNHFKDKFRVTALGIHKLRPYEKMNAIVEGAIHFFALC